MCRTLQILIAAGFLALSSTKQASRLAQKIAYNAQQQSEQSKIDTVEDFFADFMNKPISHYSPPVRDVTEEEALLAQKSPTSYPVGSFVFMGHYSTLDKCKFDCSKNVFNENRAWDGTLLCHHEWFDYYCYYRKGWSSLAAIGVTASRLNSFVNYIQTDHSSWGDYDSIDQCNTHGKCDKNCYFSYSGYNYLGDDTRASYFCWREGNLPTGVCDCVKGQGRIAEYDAIIDIAGQVSGWTFGILDAVSGVKDATGGYQPLTRV